MSEKRQKIKSPSPAPDTSGQALPKGKGVKMKR